MPTAIVMMMLVAIIIIMFVQNSGVVGVSGIGEGL